MVADDKIITFDDCAVNLNSFVAIIGMRKSGKTVLLRGLVNKLLSSYCDEILGIWVYSRTAYVNSEDYDFTVNIKKVDPEDVKRHLIKQEQLKLLSKRDQRVKCKNVVLILDDFISDIPHAGSREARVLDTIAAMGRHFNITCILLSQHYSKLSTTVRNNCNYIYCTAISQQTLFSLFPLQTDYTSKQIMWKDYNEFTKKNKYGCMLMQREDPMEPNVYYVKACPLVHFIDLNESEGLKDLKEDDTGGDDAKDDQTGFS